MVYSLSLQRITTSEKALGLQYLSESGNINTNGMRNDLRLCGRNDLCLCGCTKKLKQELPQKYKSHRVQMKYWISGANKRHIYAYILGFYY